MDVEITWRNRRNGKETFLFYLTWLLTNFLYVRERGGYLVDIMALGVGAYLLGGAYSRKYGIND